MRHAVVAGSLGKGNTGDDAILQAFLDEHAREYASVIVLTHDPQPSQDPSIIELRPPHIAVGKRFWRGMRERSTMRDRIRSNAGDGPVDYVWLGGLLGRIAEHVEARRHELQWARSFADRFVYYFGDAEDELVDVGAAERLVAVMNRGDAWIAVRSPEAAAVLQAIGVQPPIVVGVDPALFDRAKRRGLPFPRAQAATNLLAIIPCGPFEDAFRESWIAAAHKADDCGYQIKWVSMCDPVDLDLCQSLQRECQGTVVQAESAERALADAACVMATRYHGAIFGVSAGVATIICPYSSKMRRLVKLMDLDRWVVNAHADSAKVPTLIEQVLAGEWRMDAEALARSVDAHAEAVQQLRTGRRAGS